MNAATLRTLRDEIIMYLSEHPEHGDLPVYVPYDSQMAETTVYGGIRYEQDECGGRVVIDGDS